LVFGDASVILPALLHAALWSAVAGASLGAFIRLTDDYNPLAENETEDTPARPPKRPVECSRAQQFRRPDNTKASGEPRRHDPVSLPDVGPDYPSQRRMCRDSGALGRQTTATADARHDLRARGRRGVARDGPDHPGERRGPGRHWAHR